MRRVSFPFGWRLDCRIQSPGRGDNGGGGLRGRFFLFAQNRFFAKQVDWKEKDFLTEESPQISSFSDSYASIAPLLQTCHPFFDFCQNFCQKSALRAMEMFHCRVLVEFSLHSRRKSFLLRIRNRGFSGGKKESKRKRKKSTFTPITHANAFSLGRHFGPSSFPSLMTKRGLEKVEKVFHRSHFPIWSQIPPAGPEKAKTASRNEEGKKSV